MTKSDELDDTMRVLSTGTCDTLSGSSKLTYHIGSMPDGEIYIRVHSNTGGGFFSQEWISLRDILTALKKRPEGKPIFNRRFTMNTQSTVTRQLVPEDQRLAITKKLFGMWFPMRIEPVVFSFTERLSRDYKGGYWDFYTLSNVGFYMAPAGDCSYHVVCENQFEGDQSADALGITVCLYAYSNLSFSGPDAFADICFDHYHWLREHMIDHAEVEAILGALD